MFPPDNHQDETSHYAIEAVRRSERPLNGAQILELIPPTSRVRLSQLEELLAAASAKGAVFVWPPYLSRATRYWRRPAEDHAEARLMELLTNQSLSLREIEKVLARDLRGHTTVRRRALIRASLNALQTQGGLYEYPRLGPAGLKYSRRPAEAGPYLKAVKKAFDALALKLGSAGITREQMIAALRDAVPPAAVPVAANLEQRILEALQARPGGLSLRELRASMQVPGSPRDVFDRAVLSLYQSNRVYLDRHDRPMILSDSEREELVSDGAGNYYIGVTVRGSGA